jgi:hypothetical protein
MSVFYNSVIVYDEASTPYDGVATVYTYAGNIEIRVIPSYSILDGAINTFYYEGRLLMEVIPSHTHVRGFVRRPSTDGISIRIVPNSSMVIRNYKNIKDPIRTGGCPQCGTFLYNK